MGVSTQQICQIWGTPDMSDMVTLAWYLGSTLQMSHMRWYLGWQVRSDPTTPKGGCEYLPWVPSAHLGSHLPLTPLE
jgi:hypothetical protein